MYPAGEWRKPACGPQGEELPRALGGRSRDGEGGRGAASRTGRLPNCGGPSGVPVRRGRFSAKQGWEAAVPPQGPWEGLGERQGAGEVARVFGINKAPQPELLLLETKK